MYDVRITVVKRVEHTDLIEKYENPIEHACDLRVGDVFISLNAQRPEGLCESAWQNLYPYVFSLACGGADIHDGWMKDPDTAMISCNDGFRPVSFLLKKIR